jgi:peptide deformylase
VYKYGEKVLRQKSQPVMVVTDELRVLADEMLELMYDTKGVGLAAQQVGRTERLCVIDIPEGCESEEDEAFNAPIAMPLVLFNPEIISRSGEQRDKEGCLSFPQVGGSVTRANEVVCTTGAPTPTVMVTAMSTAKIFKHSFFTFIVLPI